MQTHIWLLGITITLEITQLKASFCSDYIDYCFCLMSSIIQLDLSPYHIKELSQPQTSPRAAVAGGETLAFSSPCIVYNSIKSHLLPDAFPTAQCCSSLCQQQCGCVDVKCAPNVNINCVCVSGSHRQPTDTAEEKQ